MQNKLGISNSNKDPFSSQMSSGGHAAITRAAEDLLKQLDEANLTFAAIHVKTALDILNNYKC
jgi:hypothetical protein